MYPIVLHKNMYMYVHCVRTCRPTWKPTCLCWRCEWPLVHVVWDSNQPNPSGGWLKAALLLSIIESYWKEINLEHRCRWWKWIDVGICFSRFNREFELVFFCLKVIISFHLGVTPGLPWPLTLPVTLVSEASLSDLSSIERHQCFSRVILGQFTNTARLARF